MDEVLGDGRVSDARRRPDHDCRRHAARRVERRSSSRRGRRIALVYLSTLGAIGGFVAYTYALRHLPVSFVSLYAYINPVIAVALGVLVLHEPFTWRMAIAAALVFAGVAVVRLAQRPAVATTPAATVAVEPTRARRPSEASRERPHRALGRSRSACPETPRDAASHDAAPARQTLRPLTSRTRNSTIAMTSRT